jgi:type IV pilus assembly protein PilB
MTSSRRKRIGEIIVAKGIVTQGQVNEILIRADGREKRVGELLVNEGLITEEVLAQALAEQRDLRYTELTDFRVAPMFFETIPVELMQRYQFIPLEVIDETLIVAMSDPITSLLSTSSK